VTAVARLQAWFPSHCDGDREHDNGCLLTTLDNPGWALTPKLSGTTLEGFAVVRVAWEGGPDDTLTWIGRDG